MDESVRRLRDPQELRVLAHPVRQRLLQVLYERGASTATEVAELIGESPANCSWHLRQLARYGFVEETGEGRGRQRPWRAAGRALHWGDSDDPPATAAAGDELSMMILEREFDALRAWLAWRRTDPPEWQDAGGFSQSGAWVTVDELAAIDAEIMAIFMRYNDRLHDPAKRPEGARRIRMLAWAVPAEPLADRGGS
jgi:DNA-binding transcriptional ArsR family regulator